MTLLMIPAVYDLTVVIQADAITVLLNIYIASRTYFDSR